MHRRDEVFVAETRQARRRRPTLKIRMMAWLALGDAIGLRCGRSGCTLCRPTLGREIGRDLAKVLLHKGFGDGRHNRVVAFAIPVVAHLLEKIAPLLPPDDGTVLGSEGTPFWP